MIIVLKNADFSANNIGRVEIKKDINPFTLAAITASGNSSMTNEQKSALDTFFGNIGAFGGASDIWSKLDRVYIPFLSTELSKSCVNYKTNIVDKYLSADRYVLRNKGITGVAESPSRYTETAIDEDVAIDTRNLSVFGMLMESDVSLVQPSFFAHYNGNSNLNRWYATFSPAGNGAILMILQGIKPSGSANYGLGESYPTSYKLMGINIRASNDIVYLKEDNLYSITNANSFIEGTGKDTPSKSLAIFTDSNMTAMSSNAPSIGMMFLGKGLTDAELLELKSASESLVEFFK